MYDLLGFFDFFGTIRGWAGIGDIGMGETGGIAIGDIGAGIGDIGIGETGGIAIGDIGAGIGERCMGGIGAGIGDIGIGETGIGDIGIGGGGGIAMGDIGIDGIGIGIGGHRHSWRVATCMSGASGRPLARLVHKATGTDSARVLL
jgi:hypothetical protein